MGPKSSGKGRSIDKREPVTKNKEERGKIDPWLKLPLCGSSVTLPGKI